MFPDIAPMDIFDDCEHLRPDIAPMDIFDDCQHLRSLTLPQWTSLMTVST